MTEAATSRSVGTVDAAIIVCTYSLQRISRLRALLGSIDHGSVRPQELLVVVDGSPDLAGQVERELGPRRRRILVSTAGGLSAARNVGWQASTARWSVFVDDDAVVDRSWLEQLHAIGQATEAHIVGGKIDPIWPRAAPSWYSERLGWVVGCSYRGLPEATAPVRAVIGCSMAIRRDILAELDGFAESLGRQGGGLLGSEETELCFRAGKRGSIVMYAPQALAWQVVGAERTRFRYAVRRGWAEGRSKAALVALHGGVLGREKEYTRALVAETAEKLVIGAVRLRLRLVQQAIAMLVVLGVTGLAYGLHRARSGLKRWPHR